MWPCWPDSKKNPNSIKDRASRRHPWVPASLATPGAGIISPCPKTGCSGGRDCHASVPTALGAQPCPCSQKACGNLVWFFFPKNKLKTSSLLASSGLPAAQGRTEPGGQQHPARMQGWTTAPGLQPGLGGRIRDAGSALDTAPCGRPHAAALPGGPGSPASRGRMEGAGNLLSSHSQKKHMDSFLRVHWGGKVDF